MKNHCCEKRNQALTMLEVFFALVGIAIIGMALWPAKVGDRGPGHLVACRANLKQIGLCFMIYAGDNGGRFPTEISSTNASAGVGATNPLITYFEAISYEIGDPRVIVCPADSREAATNFNRLQLTNISYFLSADATVEMTNTILGGDRNLEVAREPVKPGMFVLTAGSPVTWTREMHSKSARKPCGHVLLGDGSVMGCWTNFSSVIARQELLTNRLLIP